MFDNFFQGKRVLVTGHTGFKGAWLSLWLKELHAEVWGVSLPPPTHPNLYEIIQPHAFAGEIECDVRNFEALASAVNRVRPQVIFHLAAQSLVRRSYVEPLETFATNATGTVHLLESVRRAELNCILVVVTSDKCYENREWEFAYRENDALGGHDVYSMSKAAAELVAQAWNKSFFLPGPNLGPVVTVRAGNVIGGGDYAADRIVPDCVRALMAKKPVLVRNPQAIRPWQHVLECLSGYLWLAARLGEESKSSRLASPFNFGPDVFSHHPVGKLVEELLRVWPGQWLDGSNPNAPHEATRLCLSIEKAVALLGWRPVWSFSEAVRQTMLWYYERHAVNSSEMAAFSARQIADFAAAAKQKNVAWA